MAQGKVRVARKATKGKGKKWKKGYSSSSNPEIKKHRDNAKRAFFHYQGHSKLTEQLLAAHNANENDDEKVKDPRVKEFESEVFSVGGDTFNTFATVWSECTNPSFNRLMRNWQSGSALHKEMLAIIAAVTEVIKERGGRETESEYFAALMTTLESVETEDSKAAVITLLGMVMKNLSISVLKLKFSSISKALIGTLAEGTDNNAIIRGVIGCLCLLLRTQELMAWNDSSTVQIYNVLLSFAVHAKPKIRKAAHHAVTSILKFTSIPSEVPQTSVNPAVANTATFCMQKLQEPNSAGGLTTKLHILSLLKEVIGLFSKSHLKSTCETILRLMTIGSPIVTRCSFQTLSGLFSGRKSQSYLTSDLIARLVTALYDYQPNNNDTLSTLPWLEVQTLALVHLFQLDAELCLKHITKYVCIIVKCWLSDKPEVIKAVADSVKELLRNCVQPLAEDIPLCVSETQLTTPQVLIQKIVSSIENCLKFQFHSAWPCILQTITVLYEAVGKTCGVFTIKILQSLSDLRETHKFEHCNEVDRCIGAAVKTVGPRLVLKAIPFKPKGNEIQFDFPKSWLIPILRDNVKETELLFFAEYFMPLAITLKNQSSELEKAERKIEAKTCGILYSQIWSMLPGFCIKPTDFLTSFKKVAKPLGQMLGANEDLRLFLLSALRNLINYNTENEANQQELSRYAKNYLPILFNLYTTEAKTSTQNSVRLAIYETIKIYMKITPQEIVLTLFQKAQERIGLADMDAFNRHALLDLCRVLLPYLSVEQVAILFQDAKPLLENADRTIQKKSYRILEEICQSESEGCRAFVNSNISLLQELLLGTLPTAVASSKAPRLRCLSSIVQCLDVKDDAFIRVLVSEAVLCTKISSVKARGAAYQLLVETGKAEMRWNPQNTNQALSDYLQLILAGLAGNPHLVSATVLALGNLFYEFHEDLSTDMSNVLIDNICLLMTSKSREIVQSALAFFKTVLSVMDTKSLARFLPMMIKSLVEISDESQRHFRFKAKEIFIRFVRKFGFENIIKMVPESHRKMLSNIRKTESRKARSKKEESEDLDNTQSRKFKSDELSAVLNDSDEEMDEPENERKVLKGKRRLKNKAWIEEAGEDDIVDFLDPSVNQKLHSTKPNSDSNVKKKLKHDFKTAADGRLIITGIEDERVSKSKNLKGKSKSDDMDDLTEAVETIDLSKKRKRNADSDEDDEDQSGFTGGKGIRRNLHGTQTGAKYKAKKAGGDIKKKGQLEPYAYIPLDRQVLNKRKRAKFGKHFGGVAKSSVKKSKKIGKKK